MTETEARMVVAGARYFTSIGSFSFGELLGVRAPGSLQTDARDTWYTARDLWLPDHENVWVSEATMCDPHPISTCTRCGRRSEHDQ